MKSASLPCFVLASLALLAGCGGDGSDETVTVQETVTEEAPTTTEPTTTEPTDTSTTPAESGPTSKLRSFKTPTGNIGCYIDADNARCDIRNRDWPLPPRPAGCTTETDYGQGLTVSGGGRGELVCAGDTALDPGAKVLDYGASSKAGAMTCTSRKPGVTCTNGDTRHGFFLARERYRLF